jgi:hypothetical protein
MSVVSGLGNGASIQQSRAVHVTTGTGALLTPARSVSGAAGHSCAVCGQGTGWCLEADGAGRLGVGTTNTPVPAGQITRELS